MKAENEVDKKIDSFFEDLAQNDKKVQEEINKKDRQRMSEEFVDFVRKNNCKLKDVDEDGE